MTIAAAALKMFLAIGAGYLFGSLPFGLWLGRWFRQIDIRTVGSGNLGATNVYRTLGPGLGVATLLLDILKGALPVWIVPAMPFADSFPGGPEVCALLVGLGAITGHVWTFLAGFKGGKGVATAAGVAFALAPQAFGIALVIFVLTVALTRYISLGSILGAVTFAIALATTSLKGPWSPTAMFGVLVAVLVIVRHRENLKRLLHGTERRFSLRGGSGS